MSNDYEVKGSSLRSKFDFVRERFGEAAEARLRPSFADEPGLFSISDSSWYPFDLYGCLNRAIAEWCYDGRSAEVRLEGAPVYSDADLNVAAGFYAGAAKLLGVERLRHRFATGPDGARFELQWS